MVSCCCCCCCCCYCCVGVFISYYYYCITNSFSFFLLLSPSFSFQQLVKFVRLLSGGGAGGKKINPAVETTMRPNVRDADNIINNMRTLANEIGVECNTETFNIDDVLNENASEQYNGQFLDDAQSTLEAKLEETDPWRNKEIGAFTMCALQWALQHGLYKPNKNHFIDCSGTVINDNEFRSIIDGSESNLDILGMPKIGLARLTKYCEDHYGEWTSLADQNIRRTKRSRKTRNKGTNAVSDVARVSPIVHGPTINQGRFLGNAVRQGDTKIFNELPTAVKRMKAIDEVYSKRCTTVDSSAINSTKNVGDTGIVLFTSSTIVAELNRIIDDWSNHAIHKGHIQRILGRSKLDPTAKWNKKEVAMKMVQLRHSNVPVSNFLLNDTRPVSVKSLHGTYYFKNQFTMVQGAFNPFDQPFIHNTLTGNDVTSAVQLCPDLAAGAGTVATTNTDVSSDSDDDVAPRSSASIVTLFSKIDQLRGQQLQ